MYMEHRLGIKLAIINVGEVPPVFLPLVQEVKARLKSKKTENKMLTFMFRASPGDVPTEFSSAWVAVSGEGNAHKSAETSTRLAGLPIQFVPYLPEMPEDNSPPTDPVINFLEYPNRKLIFNRFMIFVTNALKSDGSFNEDIAGMFHLTPPLIEHIRRIKDFLRSPGLIPAYRAYLADPAIINAQEYDIPLKFLQLVAWQCYNDDIFFEVNSKVVIPLTLGTLEFSDPVTGELIYNSSFRRNAGYIAALDLAKDDPLYAAFAALWDHTGRFTFDAMTRKMQHCAETNLIAYLRDEKSKGNDILKNPGKFYVFSTAMSEAGCDIAALCDNCSHRSLPDIAELNIAAGDTTARTTIAMIPVTTPQPLSTAPFLRLTATELEEIGEIALEGNYF